jgi:hypothetical protein
MPPSLRPAYAGLEVLSPDFDALPVNANGFYSACKKPSIGNRSMVIELEKPQASAALA